MQVTEIPSPSEHNVYLWNKNKTKINDYLHLPANPLQNDIEWMMTFVALTFKALGKWRSDRNLHWIGIYL